MDRQLFPEMFVEMADTLVANFDVIEFLHALTDHSAQLLQASAVGLMLVNQHGAMEPLVATDTLTTELEAAQVRLGQGPCLTAFSAGRPVYVDSLDTARARWPAFADRMAEAGYVLVQALPMRLRDQRVGAMNLYREALKPFTDEDVRMGQALADIATIGLLHERALSQSEELSRQLQGALDSRVIIEQAKGKLAERTKLDPDVAFQLLRDYSRSHNYRLSDLAATFVRSGESLPGLLPS